MRDDEKLTAKSHSVFHDVVVSVMMPMFQCDCLLFLVDVIFSFIRLDETKLLRLLESCSKYIPIPNQIPTMALCTQQKSELKSSSYAMHGCIPLWIVIMWVNNTPQQRGQLTWVSYPFNYVTAHQNPTCTSAYKQLVLVQVQNNNSLKYTCSLLWNDYNIKVKYILLENCQTSNSRWTSQKTNGR